MSVISLVAPSILEKVRRVSPHTCEHAESRKELTQYYCRWKGKSRSPRFSRGRHCNEVHSVRASCDERLGKYFRGKFPNLCEQGGVTADDFFATAVMGSDDPTDGGECRLELRHGNLDKSEEFGGRTRKGWRDESNLLIYSPRWN